MAQIIITVSQRNSPAAEPKMDLSYRLRPNENTATTNTVRKVMRSLAESWHLGDVKLPPEDVGIDRVVRVAGRMVKEAGTP